MGAVHLNESEIAVDLNECEHFHTASLDWSKVDPSWIDI